MNARLKKVMITALILIGIGVLYLIIVNLTGFAIPCLFRKITGLKCPGCGVTGMCVHIARLDFKNAFYDNPALFILSPFLIFIFARYICVYVKYGGKRDRITEISAWIAVAALLIFGIVRNIVNI